MKTARAWLLLVAGCGSAPVGLGGSGGGAGTGGGGGSGGGAAGGGGSVVHLGLIAKANGQAIGDALDVQPYRLRVWDRALGLSFVINPATGFLYPAEISDSRTSNWESQDCSGTAYTQSWETNITCNVEEPLFHSAWALDAGTGGRTEGAIVVKTTGIPVSLAVWSQNDMRAPYMSPPEDWPCMGPSDFTGAGETRCLIRFEETDLVPTAFALPITVEAE